MARAIYGADGSAQVVSMAGVPTMAAATVKTARTGGTTVTDVQNMAGANLGGVVTPDSRGQIIFQGPDNSTATYWLDFGDGGPRWGVRPVDLNEMVSLAMAARELGQFTAPSGTTPKAAIPYINNTISKKIADALDGMVIRRFASASARDTAFPSPTSGDRCYRTDLNAHQTYRNLGVARWVTDPALVGEVVLASDTATVSFVGIPQEWRNLVLKYRARAIGSPANSVIANPVSARFNSDTGSTYAAFGSIRNMKMVSGTKTFETINDGTGGGAATITTTTYGNPAGGLSNYVVNGVTTAHVGVMPGSSLSGLFGGGEMTIEDYTNASGRKAVKGVSGFIDNSGTSGTSYGSHAILQAGWSNNAAITRIDMIATSATAFAAGSAFYLYGW